LWIKFKRFFKMSNEVNWNDPYAHWLPSADQSSIADGLNGRQPLQAFDGDLIPIVLELEDSKKSDEWRDFLRNTIKAKVQRRPGTRFLTALVKVARARELFDLFEANKLRWEIGAPFTSTAGFYTSNDGAVQQEDIDTEKQEKDQPIKSKKKKIIGIIDYGCAFANEKFCSIVNSPMSRQTRVHAIWDQQSRFERSGQMANGKYQNLSWRPTTRYGYGYETFRDSDTASKFVGVNEFMAQFNDPIHGFNDELCYQYANYEAILDRSATHGTYIMDFAAGVPNPLKDASYSSPSPWATDDDLFDTDIVFVQLPRIVNGETVSGVLRTFVLDAIMYILRCADDDADVVINISYGGMAGPHDGSSIVERAIDDLIEAERCTRRARQKAITEIVICAGNTRTSDMHAIKTVEAKKEAELRWGVIPDNPTLQFIEMWFDSIELDAQIEVFLPSTKSASQGKNISLNQSVLELLYDDSRRVIGQLCVVKKNSSASQCTQVLIGLNPSFVCETAAQVAACPIGEWKAVLKNLSAVPLVWNAWCERSDPIFGSSHGPRQVKFTDSTTPLATLNNLASGSLAVIAGGAVLNDEDFMAEYSSQGPSRSKQAGISDANTHIDPSIIHAPSEENLAYWALPGAGVLGQTKVRYSGTSVAAAVVSRQLISGKTRADLSSYTQPTQIRESFR
jgi:hypothetical protein